MKTRLWVAETDQYGMTDRKFFIDEPTLVPRIGEYVDGDGASGWVELVQYYYGPTQLVVYVYLKEKKL